MPKKSIFRKFWLPVTPWYAYWTLFFTFTYCVSSILTVETYLKKRMLLLLKLFSFSNSEVEQNQILK